MVPENPFAGATRDPVALLEQLSHQVAGVNRGMDEVKQDLVGVKQDLAGVKQDFGSRFDRLAAELGAVRSEIAAGRSDMGRFMKVVDKGQAAFKEGVEAVIEQKQLLARTENQERFSSIERRLAELEEAERRRREGMGA